MSEAAVGSRRYFGGGAARLRALESSASLCVPGVACRSRSWAAEVTAVLMAGLEMVELKASIFSAWMS